MRLFMLKSLSSQPLDFFHILLDSNRHATFQVKRLATHILVLPLLLGNQLQMLPTFVHHCVNSEHTNIRWCHAAVSPRDSHTREPNWRARIKGLLISGDERWTGVDSAVLWLKPKQLRNSAQAVFFDFPLELNAGDPHQLGGA
jgi:hypothetical protein